MPIAAQPHPGTDSGTALATVFPKARAFIACAIICLLALPGAGWAQTLIKDDRTVISIQNLELGPGTYDVVFKRDPLSEIYGINPAVYDFKNIDDAREAMQAIIVLFSIDGDVRQVGPSDDLGQKFFRIPFDTLDVPSGGDDVPVSALWEAASPEEPGVWFRLFDPDFYPLEQGGMVADFTLVAGEPLSTFDFQKRILFSNPGSNEEQESFMRFVNTCDSETDVQIQAIDDKGIQSPGDKVTFKLAPFAALQLTARDIEDGNTEKGIEGSLGDGSGKWQQIVESSCELDIFSNIRTPDGFLTGLDEIVGSNDAGCKDILFANPAENPNQQTFLRFVNRSTASGTITLSAIDDNGDPAPGGSVTFEMAPEGSQQMTAQDLENGNLEKGLQGGFGNGAGKWRITACYNVAGGLDVDAMSLIRTPDGFLTNLSSRVPKDLETGTINEIWFANPASEAGQETFIRFVNKSNDEVTVMLKGTDDEGAAAPGGDISFNLAPQKSLQVTASDLENGNTDKGLNGMFGDGSGRWQIMVESTGDVAVLNQIRTPDGFLTNVSLPVPKTTEFVNDVGIFNPGSNQDQRSVLRVVNRTEFSCTATVTGIDDAGNAAPGGAVVIALTRREAKQFDAKQLEEGDPNLFTGALGDGEGKWRLSVEPSTDCELEVFSLLDTPNGFITNLSRAATKF